MTATARRRARSSRLLLGHGGRLGLHLLLRRRLHRRRLLRCMPWRQERQRIDIAVRIGRAADAQVHVRLGPFGLTAGADRGDDVALAHAGPDGDADRAEVDECDRPAVLGADRQAQPLMRQLSGVRSHPDGRRPNVGPRRRADVTPSMLTARVRIVVGDERPQHRAVDGPRPGRRARSQGERREHDEQERVARSENHAGRVQGRSAVVKSAYSEAR